MPRGIKYDVTSSGAPTVTVSCRSGALLTFRFSTEVHARSFRRRYAAYIDQVQQVVSSRYRGVDLIADELALFDLYARTEIADRLVEILDGDGRTRELHTGDELTVKAVIK